jgi:hypothetical protein
MKRRDMLKASSAALVGLSAFPFGWAAAAEAKKQKVLYFTQSAGFQHSVVARTDGELAHSEKVLVEMGKRAGFEVECSKDGRVFDGDLDQYDAIAFYTSGDLTKPNPQGDPPTSAKGKQRLLDAVAAGKGFVAFHAATDSFHTPGPGNEIQTEVDPYIAMVGGEFLTHGAQQEASLRVTSQFPGVENKALGDKISFTEEWYATKNFAKDLHVILVQETKTMTGECYQRPEFPSTWARRQAKGRVFYTSLGHREDVWTSPVFQAIALGGFAWVMGNKDYDVRPNIGEVTPHANQLKN